MDILNKVTRRASKMVCSIQKGIDVLCKHFTTILDGETHALRDKFDSTLLRRRTEVPLFQDLYLYLINLANANFFLIIMFF